jgi:hypothetical protein
MTRTPERVDNGDLLWVTVANIALLATLAPVAYWQLSQGGIYVVIAASVTVFLIAWLSRATERVFAKSANVMTGFLAAMIVRMAGPLIFVLIVVLFVQIPEWAALYVVPFYFAMLAIETIFAVRRCHAGPAK